MDKLIEMEFLIALCIGITLSAASGFRVFIPPLAMSVAARQGDYPLASGFEWLATDAALITLSVATVVEILAYYLPIVDNFLDTIEIPTAITVGTILTAASLGDIDPVLQWTLALLAGGGAAGMVEGLTTMTRLASTTMTAGVGNPILSTMEALSSSVLSILAFFTPFITIIIILFILIVAGRKLWKFFKHKKGKTK